MWAYCLMPNHLWNSFRHDVGYPSRAQLGHVAGSQTDQMSGCPRAALMDAPHPRRGHHHAGQALGHEPPGPATTQGATAARAPTLTVPVRIEEVRLPVGHGLCVCRTLPTRRGHSFLEALICETVSARESRRTEHEAHPFEPEGTHKRG